MPYRDDLPSFDFLAVCYEGKGFGTEWYLLGVYYGLEVDYLGVDTTD